MKTIKKIALGALVILTVGGLTACTGPTYQHMAGNRVTRGSDVQTFHYAYVYDGNRKIAEGNVIQWRDYTNSDAVQVMLDDGKVYLTHYTNVVLVADPKLGGMAYSSGINDYN